MPQTLHRESGEAVFLSALNLIERAIASACARNHLPASERDDFGSWAKLRLIENDYAVLRAYEGRSSLRTYLLVVIRRLLLDYCASRWGKWRPSADARRAGPVAIELERLLVRDRHTHDEAYELLLNNAAFSVTRAELERLGARLVCRERRRFENDAALESLAVGTPSPDSGIDVEQRRDAAARICNVLHGALARLDVEDRLVLTMRFQDGRSVRDISVALHLDQKKLYRRIDALLQRLRRELQTAGVDTVTVRDLLGHLDNRSDDPMSGLLSVLRNGADRPSTQEEAGHAKES